MKPDVLFCIDCKYPLTGLGASRCPECGRTFDQGDERTFVVTDQLTHGRDTLLLALFPVVGIAVVCILQVFSIVSFVNMCMGPVLTWAGIVIWSRILIDVPKTKRSLPYSSAWFAAVIISGAGLALIGAVVVTILYSVLGSITW